MNPPLSPSISRKFQFEEQSASPPTASAQKVDLHYDTRDLRPIYSRLVHDIYTRPIVLTLLIASKHYSSLNIQRIERLESGDLINITADEDCTIPISAQVTKFFVIKVNDVVKSREASYVVAIREFNILLSELKQEYQTEVVVDYFNPTSVRWWVKCLSKVILVFDRPNGKLGVVVDKNKISTRVKRKMYHHNWMVGEFASSHHQQSPTMSPGQRVSEESNFSFPDLADNNSPQPPIIETSILEKQGFEIEYAKSDDQQRSGQRSPEELQAVRYDADGETSPFKLQRPAFPSPLSVKPVSRVSSSRALSRESSSLSHNNNIISSKPSTAASSRGGTKGLRKALSMKQSGSKDPFDDFDAAENNSVDDEPGKLMPSKSLPSLLARQKSAAKGMGKKQASFASDVSESRVRSAALLEEAYSAMPFNISKFAQSVEDDSSAYSNSSGRNKSADGTKRAKSSVSKAHHVSSQGNSSKQNSLVLPAILNSSRAASRQQSERMLLGSRQVSHVTIFSEADEENEHQLDDEDVNNAANATSNPLKDGDSISLNLSDAGNNEDDQYENIFSSPDRAASSQWETMSSGMDDDNSSDSLFFSRRPIDSASQRSLSPFEKATVGLKGSQKLAASIIRRARKSVSGSTKFQTRRVSKQEVRLLSSPFAKKLYIDPITLPSTEQIIKKIDQQQHMVDNKRYKSSSNLNVVDNNN